MSQLQVRPSGDCAVTIEFGNRIEETINDRVLSMAELLAQGRISGVRETIPSYSSLLVLYDRTRISYGELKEQLLHLAEQTDAAALSGGRLYKIPCCYGRYFGKDMETVCRHTGLTTDEVIFLHSAPDYRIYMMGFLPGFVYLGGMDERLVTPRLRTPRLEIPAGAVGIGGNQTGVYPLKSPGGWQLIGSTPVNFYDLRREEPVLCRTGDRIRFVPIGLSDYYDIRNDYRFGTYTPETEVLG